MGAMTDARRDEFSALLLSGRWARWSWSSPLQRPCACAVAWNRELRCFGCLIFGLRWTLTLVLLVALSAMEHGQEHSREW